MTRLRIAQIFALPVLLLLHVVPASAQATRTWVSGVGDDVNPCSRTAPCKTFAGAISKTAANGEINVIDNGAFGAVTITKAITINAEPQEAGVLATATNGIVTNAGVNDVVILRGLDIDGSPGFGVSPGLNGVRFLAGAALHVQNCRIRNFRNNAAGNGNGIIFAPSGVSELYVSETNLTNNGNITSTTSGILIQPTGSGSAKVVINRSQMENNRIGVLANSTSSTGTIAVAIFNSTVVGNSLTGIGAGTAVVST